VPIGGLIMEKYLHGELSEASKAKAQEIQDKRINYGTADR
jgi:penicillin-binding protein 2